MTPSPRFTYHHSTTGVWYIVDRLRGQRVDTTASVSDINRLARAYEQEWRQKCARWIEAEYRQESP